MRVEETTQLVLGEKVPAVIQDRTGAIIDVAWQDKDTYMDAIIRRELDDRKIHEARVNCKQTSLVYLLAESAQTPQYTNSYPEFDGLKPAVTQDSTSREVLILAFSNTEAVSLTLEKQKATYWKRTEKRLWTKGETSGNHLKLDELLFCQAADFFIYRVTPERGGACHEENARGQPYRSCYYRRINPETLTLEFIS